jgi:exocyst complex protein 7
MSLAAVDVDEADAVVLQENLGKTRALISQINASLTNIRSNTLKAQELLSPIVEKNRQLNVFKRNVDDSLLAVSNIQGIASEASVYESRLSERIDNVRQYITTIHKAEDILERLNEGSHANGGGEYKGISENLHKTIVDSEFKLTNHFRELITPISHPFDPQIFINERKPFPYLEDSKSKDACHILFFFEDNDKSIDSLYVSNRIKTIKESLAFAAPRTQHVKKNNKVPYEKGSNGINNYTEALVGFIYNEYALLEELIKEQHREVKLFKEIFKPIVDKFLQLISGIVTDVQKTLQNDGLLVFELIDNIIKLEVALQSKLIDKVEDEFPNLENSLFSCQHLARSLFKDLLVYIDQKIRSVTVLPQDNGISEITVEVMSKARRLTEYREGATKVMKGLKAGVWIPQPRPQWLTVFSSVSQTHVINDEDPEQLLSSFFSDVIDALIVSLEIKATTLIKKKQTIGYFLITNITLVEQIISRSELSKILDANGYQRLDKLKKRALNFFLTSWKQVAAYLLDVNVVGKLSSKDRELIKEKFKNFNSEFDELVKSYKQYNITDPGLKKYLSKEISFISPLYHRFYDKHSQGDFTKHTDKYIKYSKPEFDRVLDSLGR